MSDGTIDLPPLTEQERKDAAAHFLRYRAALAEAGFGIGCITVAPLKVRWRAREVTAPRRHACWACWSAMFDGSEVSFPERLRIEQACTAFTPCTEDCGAS